MLFYVALVYLYMLLLSDAIPLFMPTGTSVRISRTNVKVTTILNMLAVASIVVVGSASHLPVPIFASSCLVGVAIVQTLRGLDKIDTTLVLTRGYKLWLAFNVVGFGAVVSMLAFS